MKKGITYDDVLLVPKYSEISTRSRISLNTLVSRRYGIINPYVASCMDTVCEYHMAIKMMELGGVGCIHRFMSIDDQCEQVSKVKQFIKDNHMYEQWGVMYDNWHSEIADIPIMAAIGVSSSDVERAKKLVSAGVNIILIDVAHGHHVNVKNMLTILKNELPNHVDIIAGNISTRESAEDLCEWGADGLRVGIGGGCFTPNMKVLTSNGLKKIKDIVIGDEVYTHTGELKPVINTFEYDDFDEVYDIDGIEATANHKFYVIHKTKENLVTDDNIHDYAEWISASELTIEYFLIELGYGKKKSTMGHLKIN
jgi:IMP dehydrogenase